MKHSIKFSLLTLMLAGTPLLASSTRFDRSVVDEQARWIMHLDLDELRETAIGRHIERSWQEATDRSGDTFRFKYWEAVALIQQVTAYGVDFQRNSDSPGVLVARTRPGFSSIVEALLIQQETSGQDSHVEIIQDRPFPLYRIGGDTYLAVHSPEWIVVSKSRERIELAREVIEGNRAHLSENDGRFSTGTSRGKFFFAAADGFSDSDQLPAQAAVLRMARAGTITVGERDGEIQLDLELKTPDDVTADRLQKVAQGMLAMLALTSSNQTDWRNFTDRAIVSNDGTAVRLAASFPVEESINLLDSKSARDDELQADEDDPPDAGKSP